MADDARIQAWLAQAKHVEQQRSRGEHVSAELVSQTMAEAIDLITQLVADHDAPDPVQTKTPRVPGERRRRRSKAP